MSELRVVVSNDQYGRMHESLEEGMSVEVVTQDGGTTCDINGKPYTLEGYTEVEIATQPGQDLTDFWDNVAARGS